MDEIVKVESILATVRELEGAIVISTALHRLGKAHFSSLLKPLRPFKALLKLF